MVEVMEVTEGVHAADQRTAQPGEVPVVPPPDQRAVQPERCRRHAC